MKPRKEPDGALTEPTEPAEQNQRGFTISLPGGCSLFDDSPWIVAQEVFGGPISRFAEPILVHEVRLLLDQGFVLSIDDDQPNRWREILFRPRWFGHLQNSAMRRMRVTSEELEQFDSIATSLLLCFFVDLGTKRIGLEARRLIESGDVSFDDIRADDGLPDAFADQNFKDFFIQRYMSNSMPSRKKGKKKNFDLGVIGLYELAISISLQDECSWAKACEKAVEQRPDLVPTSWKSDPVGNLIRKEVEKLELSRWTLAGWRKDQD